MKKVICREVMTFDELNDKAKERARDWFREVVMNDSWYDQIYEDAANVGLKITGFDIGRGNDITGEFIVSAIDTAKKILAEHGSTCETFLTVKCYQDALDGDPETVEDYENTEHEFLHDLLENYLVMLRRESEYMESAEYLDEGILANEYTFTVDGKREG